MIIWIKFTNFSPFSLLIPKMLKFTLAISYLTTSNLPWFMDLTFTVSMQYCCLQHWTLLRSPVISTRGYCFHSGSIFSLFLELFLYSSSVVKGWIMESHTAFPGKCIILRGPQVLIFFVNNWCSVAAFSSYVYHASFGHTSEAANGACVIVYPLQFFKLVYNLSNFSQRYLSCSLWRRNTLNY